MTDSIAESTWAAVRIGVPHAGVSSWFVTVSFSDTDGFDLRADAVDADRHIRLFARANPPLDDIELWLYKHTFRSTGRSVHNHRSGDDAMAGARSGNALVDVAARRHTFGMTSTIKVSDELRERLKEQAARDGITLGAHLALLADAEDRRWRLRLLKSAIDGSRRDRTESHAGETEH